MRVHPDYPQQNHNIDIGRIAAIFDASSRTSRPLKQQTDKL